MRISAYFVLGAAMLSALPAVADEPASSAAPASAPYGSKPPAPEKPAEPAPPAKKPDASPEAAKQAEPEPSSAPGEIAAALFPFVPRKYIPKIELHGSAYVWFYQPITNIDLPALTPDDRFLTLYLAGLEFDAKFSNFGLYFNPRFRDSPVRKFFNSNVWIQQVYAYYEHEYVKIKAGKIENALSRLSDDTFNGPLPYYDGIKYDNDYGVSAEGSLKHKSGFGLNYYAQYFYVDGHTNGSIDDRDTVWVRQRDPANDIYDDVPGPDGQKVIRQFAFKDANRLHIAVLRIEPWFRFNPKMSLRAGLAGQFFVTDFRDGNPPQQVLRLDADLSFAAGPVKVFGEFIGQLGQTVTRYPLITQANQDGTVSRVPVPSTQSFYLLGGAELQIWRFQPRYSLSFVNYINSGVIELLHIPGVTVTLSENVSLMFEYVYWPRKDPNQPYAFLLDNSFNAVVSAGF